MNYMKFCPHCGKSNDLRMPFCIYCGHPLVMGNSLNYQQAKKNFDTYLNVHPVEETKFEHKHFQICPKCHRKCLLNMDFCAWCGAKLNHKDQYENYKLVVTTSDIIPGYTYKDSNLISAAVKINESPSLAISKATKALVHQCSLHKGNAIISFHMLTDSNSDLIVYGTSVIREPLQK